MYSTIRENDRAKYSITDYVADTEADINDLPTTVSPGSTCIVIETSNVYMLNNQKQWKQM